MVQVLGPRDAVRTGCLAQSAANSGLLSESSPTARRAAVVAGSARRRAAGRRPRAAASSGQRAYSSRVCGSRNSMRVRFGRSAGARARGSRGGRPAAGGRARSTPGPRCGGPGRRPGRRPSRATRRTVLARAHRGGAARRRAGPAGSREVVQVGALVVVELERPRERLDHRLARVRALALLQARVVGRADAGELGEFLAPQPGHPARAEGDDPDALGREARAAAAEEVAERADGRGSMSLHGDPDPRRGGLTLQCQAARRGVWLSGGARRTVEAMDHDRRSPLRHRPPPASDLAPRRPADGELHARRRLLDPQRRAAGRSAPTSASRSRTCSGSRPRSRSAPPASRCCSAGSPTSSAAGGCSSRAWRCSPRPRSSAALATAPGAAAGRPRRPGARHRRRHPGRAVAADDVVPRRAAARAGARAQRRADGGRVHDRRDARRRC